MEYQSFYLDDEYTKFMTGQAKERCDKDFRKKVLLPQLKKCIKKKNILRLNVGDEPLAYRFLNEIFANIMRENKIDYDTLITHLDLQGNEIIVQGILDMFAKTKQELEYAEMEKPTLKEKMFGLLPSILQYLIKDIIKFLKALREGRKMFAPSEIVSYRMEQCKKCENLNPSVLGKRCKICGCFLHLKTKLSFENCPDYDDVKCDEWRENE